MRMCPSITLGDFGEGGGQSVCTVRSGLKGCGCWSEGGEGKQEDVVDHLGGDVVGELGPL